MSEEKTRWGRKAFTYTDKVPYQHKTYEFKIPFQEIGRPQMVPVVPRFLCPCW